MTPRRRRRWFRLGRTVTVVAVLVGLAVAGPWRTDAPGAGEAPDPWEAIDPDAAIMRLTVGTCFDPPTEATAGDVVVVPCDGPHHAEVFHVTRLTDERLPSNDALLALAEDVCRDAFAAYVARAYEDSALDYGQYLPTPQTWPLGDRDVTCWLHAGDRSPLVGTMRGSGA